NFIHELDTLLSLFPVDGSPLLLLGHFNLPSDKLQSSCLQPLLSSFDLTLNPSPPTHRGGNTLDLVFSRPTPALDVTVNKIFSTCPLVVSSNCSNWRELRRAERKWRRPQLDSDLHTYQAILSRFSGEVTTAKSSFYKRKLEESASDPRKLFSILSSLLNPPSPPPPSSLTPEDFVTFFEEKACKTARVVPILKKPSLDSSDISSYRPNQLQDINQSGFKPAHSTETALIVVTERLHAARSAKLSSVLILLDLSAAFDTVNHKILLSVLTDLGITGTAWKWFESYLEDRHYQVCKRISACLTDISSWMTAHHLKLNPSKTELLFIPSTTGPHRDLAISFGNSLITPTEDARSLGVILDGQLSFSAHIANLTRSCRFLLYNIRSIRPFLSQEVTQLLVQSLVISRLDYCNSLLAGLPLWAIRPLQLVQNAAACLIFNLPKFTHVTPLLRSLHWLPVVTRIRFKTLRPTKPRMDQRLPTLWRWYQHWPPVRAVSELV
ncbi:hypothetical protein NFI96_010736, partial [Prochilodus magdalenae]